MPTLLIVEDDALLLDALTGQLKQLEYDVCTACSVAQATALLQTQAVDGIILDLGLPGADGMELLTWVRGHIAGLPVLILTARDGIDDRVAGLNAGADDYITKPFNMQELQARLQAMLRRARQPAFTQPSSASGGPSTTIGALLLDHASQAATLDGTPLELTQREWELLELLVNRCGEVVTRDDVLAAWRAGPPEPGQSAPPLASNALEVYVHRLRKKLDDTSLTIRNIRGLGYMLEKP
ncbi:two-component system response regulator [Acidovorax sp. Leaf76]|uniref:response regulator transcription factor n=1 Tax=unclassified Acidovorax TaxID=2684926 RepID=UPI0006F40FDA|nr:MULTISPECIES: response regulator transcription factor [unclassified Acidovorax]KQO21858.1 two-component system response regulator [Acidovorax sp. Leaf76]KQO34928.1 two-component system response regulator [Acidovorax sp. Leaf84]KQS34713.1 two-component system response regulator [Acidovorax sp. Leaf191]